MPRIAAKCIKIKKPIIFLCVEDLLHLMPKRRAGQFGTRDLLIHYRDEVFPGNENLKILDLGCGDGRSYDWVSNIFANFEWLGMDIESSPEVDSRIRNDCKFITYNGVNVPAEDSKFDLVISHQVFEHVRYPEKVLKEIFRVLRPNGLFIGSVSYLEPYHSFSIFNYTPWGWKVLVEAAGLTLKELAPGIDGISLIERRLDRASFDNKRWSLSPFNAKIAAINGLSRQRRNLKMLLFSGHIAFCAQKL